MAQDSTTDVPDSIGKAQSIVQHLINKQTHIQAAKVGIVVANGATTIREIGDVLQKRRPSKAALEFTMYLADRTEAFSDYLKQTDGSELLEDFQRYGRSRPVVASLIAIASGFAAARVLKVSSIRARFSA